MPTITLFEHQKRSYGDLGWHAEYPALRHLEQLNEAAGAELIQLGRRQLRATQYVGVIRLGDTTLQILPKIDHDPAGDADAQTDSIPFQAAVDTATRNLLHLLSYTHHLNLKDQAITPLLAHRSDWFELLTRLLAADLHRLIKRGAQRAYVMVEETLPVMRGRWQLDRQLTRKPHVRHLFDVRYDEFSPDTPLNQVFRHVIDCLLLRSRDPGNRRLLSTIRRWLIDVECPAQITQNHLDRIHFTRLNERFRPAFNLACLFIQNQVFQLTAGRHNTFAFVFDMNILFEEFVYRFIDRHRRRILPGTWADALIKPQSRGKRVHLAHRLPGQYKVLRLKPDILFAGSYGRTLLVLDTKYKQLDADRRRLGISESDMYQMLAYAVGLDCTRTLLLYPHSAASPPGPVEFDVQGHPSRIVAATINLRQQLAPPDVLIRELRALFKEVSTNGSKS